MRHKEMSFTSFLFTRAIGLTAVVLLSLCGFTQPAAELLSAIRTNNTIDVKKALQSVTDVNARDEEGDTYLQNAVLYASPEVVEWLLQKGADVNAQNKDGETALLWAAHDLTKLKLLLQYGADVNKKAMTGNTALLVAAVGANTYDAVKLLLDKGADANVQNLRKETALIRAAIFGDTATLSLLVKAGNNVNAMDTIGATPLLQAVFNVNRNATLWLLQNGADPDKIGAFGLTALGGVVTFNDMPSVQAVLQKTAAINVVDSGGISPLMWAVYNEHDNPEIIQALLDRGANVNWKAKNGETALTWALRKGSTKTAALLKKWGAQ